MGPAGAIMNHFDRTEGSWSRAVESDLRVPPRPPTGPVAVKFRPVAANSYPVAVNSCLVSLGMDQIYQSWRPWA